MDVLRLIDAFRSQGLLVGSVVITQYAGQPAADAFRRRMEHLGMRVYLPLSHCGLPQQHPPHRQRRGLRQNDYIETPRPWWWSPPPAPAGSGKMAVCLSQLYHEYKRGVKAGYAKFETFPIWNLPSSTR